ncbi:hypothetical protein SLS62_005903 [Diatrype stigma]|uniref:Uncharacterized protein n=1 Tax=Diatrype stigma TaxID=117547 RepID=A0AAN9UZL7_9PEZI
MQSEVKWFSEGSRETQMPRGGAVSQNVEFLFVVLEVTVFEDELVNGVKIEADRWGNYTPPSTWMGYGSEGVGKVFKYDNGTVSPAEGYVWYRPAPHYPGRIGKWNFAARDRKGNLLPAFEPCRPHTSRTIFDGGNFLGILIKMKDVSVNPIYEDNNGYYTDEDGESDGKIADGNDGCGAWENWSESGDVGGDVGMGVEGLWGVSSELGYTSITETGWSPMYGWMDWREEKDSEPWLPMRFEHDNGVSRISLGDEGGRCAAAWGPSWIPNIVPALYTNLDAHPRSVSRGLGGDMAAVIGLLALTQETNHCDEAFYRPQNPDTELGGSNPDEYHQAEVVWKEQKWNGTRHSNACGCS